MKRLLFLSFMAISLLLHACGGGGGGSDPDEVFNPAPEIVDPGNPVNPDTAVAVGAIKLSASPLTIKKGKTSTVTAVLYDASGQLIGAPKEVVFTLDSPALASIVSPKTASSGVATTTFTARDAEGTVTVTATVDGKTDTETIQISSLVSAETITVIPNPATISLGGTTVVSATVKDGEGSPMPNGTTVNFSVNNTAIGTIVASATTTNGVAQATFKAGTSNSGTVTVTATSGSISNTGDIIVNGAEAGSIEFVSATPQIISIKTAGGIETSEVKFLVKDSNGSAIVGSKTVKLSLSGPNGGEYLGSVVGTTTLNVGTVNGFATVILHSGTIPGTATITATVLNDQEEETGLTTSSGVIAIGGGVPSAGHFSLSADLLNIAGLNHDNVENAVNVLLADRYGNFNVLKGTTVSFYSECGAIDRAVALDEQGRGTVTFRTQEPRPVETTPDAWAVAQKWAAKTAYQAGEYVLPSVANGKVYRASIGGTSGDTEPNWPLQENGTVLDGAGGLKWAYVGSNSGSCGEMCDLENAVISAYKRLLDVDLTADTSNPRDGICTIVAVVDGEEEFTDANADGVYNPPAPGKDGETYVDSYDDIHIDMDDDPLAVEVPSAGMPFDGTFEDLVVDRDKDGTFDGLNDVWDGNKRITKRINLLITGDVYHLDLSSTTINIPHQGSQTIYFALSDVNYNRPVAGTTLTVTATGAKHMGLKTHKYLASSAPGAPIFSVTLLDPDSTKEEVKDVELKFTWEGDEISIFGQSH